MTTPNPHAYRAVRIAGGQVKLAAAIGCQQSTVSGACTGRKRFSARCCIEIERLTKGAVRCEDLRPDIDWGYLRTHPIGARHEESTTATEASR